MSEQYEDVDALEAEGGVVKDEVVDDEGANASVLPNAGGSSFEPREVER